MHYVVLGLLMLMWTAFFVLMFCMGRKSDQKHKELFDKRARAFIWDWSVQAETLRSGETKMLMYRANPSEDRDQPSSWIRVTLSNRSMSVVIEYDYFADFPEVHYITFLQAALRREHVNVTSHQAKPRAKVPEPWTLISISED